MRKLIFFRVRAVLSSVFLTTILGCSSGTENYDLIKEFSVPEGAYNVKRRTLGSNGAEQLFFQTKETYPSTRVLDTYRDFLRNHGWIQCSGANKKWSSHEDRSSSPYLLVHKLSEHWIKRGDHKLLILSAMYYSEKLTNERPDNDEQHLIVWVQRVADLEKELSGIGVACNL